MRSQAHSARIHSEEWAAGLSPGIMFVDLRQWWCRGRAVFRLPCLVIALSDVRGESAGVCTSTGGFEIGFILFRLLSRYRTSCMMSLHRILTYGVNGLMCGGVGFFSLVRACVQSRRKKQCACAQVIP